MTPEQLDQEFRRLVVHNAWLQLAVHKALLDKLKSGDIDTAIDALTDLIEFQKQKLAER